MNVYVQEMWHYRNVKKVVGIILTLFIYFSIIFDFQIIVYDLYVNNDRILMEGRE